MKQNKKSASNNTDLVGKASTLDLTFHKQDVVQIAIESESSPAGLIPDTIKKEKSKNMWYVIQVISGKEENICTQLRRYGIECFVLYCEKKKRYKKEWHVLEERLFPGYIFVNTLDVGNVVEKCRLVEGFSKLVRGGEEIIPLPEEERSFFQEISGGEHIVKMSSGISKDGKIKVSSGPLQGKESSIVYANRHKRIARMDIKWMGKKIKIEVGLEIIAKYGKELFNE